jgi:hypothetical protein
MCRVQRLTDRFQRSNYPPDLRGKRLESNPDHSLCGHLAYLGGQEQSAAQQPLKLPSGHRHDLSSSSGKMISMVRCEVE